MLADGVENGIAMNGDAVHDLLYGEGVGELTWADNFDPVVEYEYFNAGIDEVVAVD